MLNEEVSNSSEQFGINRNDEKMVRDLRQKFFKVMTIQSVLREKELFLTFRQSNILQGIGKIKGFFAK